MKRDIYLNIDTIILRGFAHVDRHSLADSLQQALFDHLSANPTLTGTDTPRVEVNINLPSGFSMEQLGRAVAHSVGNITSSNAEAACRDQKTSTGGQEHA